MYCRRCSTNLGENNFATLCQSCAIQEQTEKLQKAQENKNVPSLGGGGGGGGYTGSSMSSFEFFFHLTWFLGFWWFVLAVFFPNFSILGAIWFIIKWTVIVGVVGWVLSKLP